MKNHFLVYFLPILILFSCKNQQEGLTEINSFLQANFEFNNRTLNKNKGDYYRIIEEVPTRKIEKLKELDLRFELLISTIDSAIQKKENNLENIITESDEILNEIPKIVNNKKDYLLPEFKQPKTDSNDLNLKYIKNKLVIAMAYAFEYSSRITYSADRLYKVEIDSIIVNKTNNGIKLTLTSKYGQSIKENRHVIINNIEFNGKEKSTDFKLKDNYSFADIELNSLQSGEYKINGTLRFYERDGKIDIPFSKEFKVE